MEERSVYDGKVHLTQRIINQAKQSHQLVTATERDIEKTEHELVYFNEVVANGAFPENEALENLRLERAQIEEALKASAEKEEELIKEALSDEDRYVIEEDMSDSIDRDLDPCPSVDLEPHADLDPDGSEDQRGEKTVEVAASIQAGRGFDLRMRL